MIKRTKKEEFKQLLTDHKLNINQLAEGLGCEAQIVHSWFSRKGIPVRRCSQLMKIIGCDIDDLRPFMNGEMPVTIAVPSTADIEELLSDLPGSSLKKMNEKELLSIAISALEALRDR